MSQSSSFCGSHCLKGSQFRAAAETNRTRQTGCCLGHCQPEKPRPLCWFLWQVCCFIHSISKYQTSRLCQALLWWRDTKVNQKDKPPTVRALVLQPEHTIKSVGDIVSGNHTQGMQTKLRAIGVDEIYMGDIGSIFPGSQLFSRDSRVMFKENCTRFMDVTFQIRRKQSRYLVCGRNSKKAHLD